MDLFFKAQSLPWKERISRCWANGGVVIKWRESYTKRPLDATGIEQALGN